MFRDLYQKYDLCVGQSTNAKLLKNIAQLEEISYFPPSKFLHPTLNNPCP